MGPLRLSLFRLVAVALLAWMALGAAAAPATACCSGADPCCVLTPSGQGCIGCSVAPALCAGSTSPRQAMNASAAEAPVAASKPAMPAPPWKPPD